jgi:excisionase family DNA binding protein
MSADELVTVVQAAGLLGIRPWTLRHWISDRKIDVVKYGNGIVRIRRSVLDRYVASCTIKARASHGRHTKE